MAKKAKKAKKAKAKKAKKAKKKWISARVDRSVPPGLPTPGQFWRMAGRGSAFLVLKAACLQLVAWMSEAKSRAAA